MTKLMTDGTATFRVDRIVPFEIDRNATYKVGDVVFSLTLGAKEYLECTRAGTTSKIEPNITENTKVGDSINDGTVVWKVQKLVSKEYVDNAIKQAIASISK